MGKMEGKEWDTSDRSLRLSRCKRDIKRPNLHASRRQGPLCLCISGKPCRLLPNGTGVAI